MSCQTCGGVLPPNKAPGRPRKFCSERCRKAQYDRVCVDCGGRVSGTDPGRRAEREPRCHTCARARQIENARWTRNAIIDAIRGWAAKHGRPPTATDWRVGDDHPAMSWVMRRFGSWNAAINASGLDCRERFEGRHRWPGDDLKDASELAQRYEAGESARMLAIAYGITEETVRARLRTAGVTPRSTSEAQVVRRARERAAA